MALALINKPIGHKLTGTELEANIYDDGTGTAIVYTGTSHGRSDGDYVYIQSDFDSYNGFKYVDSISYDYFKIRESETGDYVQYVQDAAIEYQVSILDHGFIAVHQPIVYEIESSIFPTNTEEESYTPNTVDSFSDADGYTQLELDQALTDPTELSKIELVGSGELAGVYQIITVLQPWSVVIDLAYNVANDFSGYIIVKYYDNYAVNVRVYAGLQDAHRWASKKPIELAATLKFIPDSDNKVKFSISEVLRSYINNRNNLTLDTLPNNIDFMVSFYIQYFESYDVSDGEDITTEEGIPTTDDFVGYALNAKLEFKNETISHLSPYLNEGAYYAQWLTLFENPIALAGMFFDISFINQYFGTDIIVDISKSGDSSETESLTFINPGPGIIRVPFTPESGFDQYCIQARTTGTPESGGDTVSFSMPALNTWVSRSISASLVDWTPGTTPIVVLPGTCTLGGDEASEVLHTATPLTFISGYTYAITIDYTRTINSGSCNPRGLFVRAYDDSFNILHSQSEAMDIGAGTCILTFIATGDETKIGVSATSGSNVDVEIDAVSATETSPVIPEVAAQIITEQICIEIIEECESTYIPDDVRLLEDGSYRLLE